MTRLWLILMLTLAAGPAAAQGLCETPILVNGPMDFLMSPRGWVLIAIVIFSFVWGWWGLGMFVVIVHGLLVLLPGLTGSAKREGVDLSIFFDVWEACGTLDYLFVLGVGALTALLIRDGLTRVRKPR